MRSYIVAVFMLTVSMVVGCEPVPRNEPYIPQSYRQPVSGASYTIQAGDTLFSIAQQNNVSISELLVANPGLDPRNLPVGASIIIPGAASVASAPASAPAHTEPAMNPGHLGPIPAEHSFVWPLEGPIIAQFNQEVPWLNGQKNSGIYIRATSGQVVVAAKSGKVYTFESVPAFGKMVEIEHSDGYITLYSHLDKILVTHGTWVKQGEPIGIAGSSGYASEVELQFRIWRGQSFVDPLPLLSRR